LFQISGAISKQNFFAPGAGTLQKNVFACDGQSFLKKKFCLRQIFFFFEIGGRHGRKHFFVPDCPLQAHRIFVSDFFSRLHVTGTKKIFFTVAAAGTKQFFFHCGRAQ
jgi:hypothetical protein